MTADESKTHSQLHILGYVAGGLHESTELIQGDEAVLRERLALLDATIRTLVLSRNRVASVLSHPASGN